VFFGLDPLEQRREQMQRTERFCFCGLRAFWIEVSGLSSEWASGTPHQCKTLDQYQQQSTNDYQPRHCAQTKRGGGAPHPKWQRLQ
jgi:hypothetical protein